jgi:two-component system, OmpR family, sensor kinase
MPEHGDTLSELLVHEVRAPLTVISGYAEILKRPQSEDERLKAIAAIERAVFRADAILEDFLAGRLGESRVEHTELVSLALVAEHVAAEEAASAGREVGVESLSAAEVLGDETQLERLVTNLVTNADKYSPAGESVTVRVFERGGTAVLEVVDRGPGIPVEARERLFEAFERLERDEDEPGMGLGLSVVRSVAEGHGGTVHIEDGDDGVGTRVVVEIPLAS